MLWIALIKTCNNCERARRCLYGTIGSQCPSAWLASASRDFTVVGSKRVYLRPQGTGEPPYPGLTDPLSFYPAISCPIFNMETPYALAR